MKYLFALCLGASLALAQIPTTQQVPENSTTRVSDHVYAIIGFPNIAIVTGTRATLVVDTGMGPRNGAVIVREVNKLARTPILYLTTTHFHPEHAAGEQAFPPNTVLVRNKAQQEDMDQHGAEYLALFSSRSTSSKELLEGVKLRPPDILFDREITLDLGGVTARLFWLGPAHTRGDEIIFVEGDSVLIPGDIVQSKLVPNMPTAEASPKGWIAILDQLEPLKPRFIVPDHGALGDGSLIQKEKAFLVDARTRSLELKRQGVNVEDAGKTVTADLKAKYPDWETGNISNIVRRVYEETP
jgi:glyoxylase-like metal-dependent hydrolase (beta-lactamase superfamily II)